MAALGAARAARIQYAVVDLKMPGGSGIGLLGDLLALDAAMRVVVLTGYGSIASAVEALHRGAHHYLSKPAGADEIVAALEGDKSTPVPTGQALPPTVARAEWEHLSRILSDCGGNVSEAARRLGITRRTLQLKLKKDPHANDVLGNHTCEKLMHSAETVPALRSGAITTSEVPL